MQKAAGKRPFTYCRRRDLPSSTGGETAFEDIVYEIYNVRDIHSGVAIAVAGQHGVWRCA
jgi:hypothetical protein